MRSSIKLSLSRSIIKLSLLAIIAAMFIISILSAVLPSSEDFHPSNPYWNGLEKFFKITNAKIFNGDIIPEKSILFIIGPSINYSSIDLKSFISNGGILIIMDEIGIANPLISDFGISIDGHFVIDAVFYYNNWKMPKLIERAIVLNLPSALKIDKGIKVLAYSSSFSFLDLNGDFEPQADEPKGPFPIIAEAPYGNGKIIVISDSSIFLNDLIDFNRKLLEDLISNREVFVDTSVWPLSLPSAYKAIVLKIYEFFSAPELKYSLALLIVILIYYYTSNYTSKEKQKEIDEIEELLKKHPNWNEKLLKAIKEARDKIE
ncbi:MAG: hypothetical protein NZ922_06955 [Candidatus Methanomethyliaceae archaeon]|nr:hypothetical protein [Candidatus Methanomethyliaceae archaeon]MDW7971547.1 hypothetical protein [Nitrososphaerota archaeon]